MDPAPLVTTIIPSYNHGRYVAEAVRSAWAQDYSNHELVVIDDGSTDNSVEVLRALAAESPIPMQVIVKENEGLSRTLNRGIGMSEAAYVNVFASDDRILPSKLRVLVSALETAGPEVGVAFGDRRIIDPQGRTLREAPSRYDPTDERRPFLDVLTRRVFIPATGSLYRRSVFAEVGGFREDVLIEDWEMWLRIADRYRIAYVPDAVVEYRTHPAQVNRVSATRIARERLAIFEGWVCRAPELADPSTRRRARAAIYETTGKTYFSVASPGRALPWMLRSIVLRPLRRSTWGLLIRETARAAWLRLLCRHRANRPR